MDSSSKNSLPVFFSSPNYLPLPSYAPFNRVGKILTARDFPCGKSRDFPGWEIPSKFGKLGNTGKYLIKILNFVVFL